MNGEKFETEYEYDLLGRTKTIEYPNDPRSGERVSAEYEYGPFGAESVRLKQGFRSKNVIESIEYNENGQIERIVRGNRTETKYVYDGRHRLKKLYAYNTANGEELQNVSYTFDDDDNVTKKADEIGFGNGKRTVVSEYKYDGLNRLVEGSGRYELGETGEHWNAYTEKYSYSDDGNLLSKILYNKTGSLDERLEYDYSNHAVTDIHSSKHGNRSVMRYSACGNMTYNSDKAKKTEKRMYYNTDNRIVKVTDKENITIGEYDYDDTGFRVRKQSRYMKDGVEKSKETITPSMYFSYEKELEISTDKELDKTYAVSHIYLNGVRIAAAMPNGECRYFLTDQVDSVNVVLNDKGDAVTRTEYKPYGETWIQEGDKTNRPKFNSQELDPETGYYFYNARYYEAEIGRFITADNIIPDEYSTQSWNRFSYCKGNPVRYKDPTGHDPADEVTRFLVDFKGFLEDTADSQLSVAKERGSNGDIVGASFWGFCGAANGVASFFLPEDRSDIELALLTAGLAQPAVVKTAKKGVKTAEKALKSLSKTEGAKKIVKTSDNFWASGKKLIEQIAEKHGDEVARKIVPSRLPHNNKTLGHWDTIVNVGIKEAMNPEVKKVLLNKGLSNVVDLAKGQKNRRLDVLTEKMNGIIDQTEVPSKTDDLDKLYKRMEETQDYLGDKAGKIRIKKIE